MALLASLWRLLDRSQRRQLAVLQLLSILMALSTVGGIAAVLPFLTALTDSGAVTHNAMLRVLAQRIPFTDERSFVIVLGLAFAAIVVIANAINLFGFVVINRFAFRVGDTLYIRLFQEYLYRDYAFHTRTNSSVLASKVLQETARVTSGILQHTLILVSNLVTIAFVVTSILILNPIVATMAVFVLGGCYTAIYVIVRGRLLRNGQMESRFYAERMRTVNESFGAIKEVAILQARGFFVHRFAEQCQRISRAFANTLTISHTPKYVLECLTIFSLVGAAVYLRSRTTADDPWMAQLSFVGFAAYRLLPALQQAFAAIVKIRADYPAFAGIEADLRRARGTEAATREFGPHSVWQGRPYREITLSDLCYRHAPDLADAVANVSLVIPAGTIVGFVGPNGSGKTTLLDLVSGLLVPQCGYIEVDGVRLDRTNCAAWQSTIAYVPQQVFVLDATLGENVAFGVPPAQINHERVEVATRLACLSECVASLPNGYAERLGERGSRLSGGQRQRLAIARALYRDASLLILDEATSALDAAAEGEIVEMLETLRPNRTILFIAHRTGALRHCDLVFELHNGRLVGTGKHGQIAPVKARVTSLL